MGDKMFKGKDEVRVLKQRSGLLLRVRWKAGVEPVITPDSNIGRSPPELFVRLLGLILAQAYHDGMSEVSFNAQQEPKVLRMRYCGKSKNGVDTWWDMTPPPADCYACLVKAIIYVTAFGSGVEPVGTIDLEINGEPVTVNVRFFSWYDVNLSWSSASDSNGSR